MTLRFLNIRTLLVIAGISLNLALFGQTIPSGPLSIPVYHPVVLNPAYAGSKDFTNISFTTKALRVHTIRCLAHIPG